MKRLLIIGASILQLPAIKRAKELGLCVAVADYNPQAVGIPYADRYYNVSTIDEQGVYEAAKDFHADGVMTLATDMPMRSVAYTCSKLGLIGISYETAVKATDKGEMIKAFEAAGVEHPWFFIINNISEIDAALEKITFPCITKPTDNAGSRGVMVASSEVELRQALQYSSENGHSGSVIVEEYMVGHEVSVEAIVYQGKPHILQITDKLTTGAPHFVEIGHSQPSILSLETKETICDLAGRAALAVGIQNGPVHAEIILTDQGPKMVEIGARMGGDCITTDLVPLSTGIDMIKATIDISLGMKPDLEQRFEKGAAIRFIPTAAGKITSIKGTDQAASLSGVKRISLMKTVGEMCSNVESSIDRIGFAIAQSDTPQNAATICENAIGMIQITTEE